LLQWQTIEASSERWLKARVMLAAEFILEWREAILSHAEWPRPVARFTVGNPTKLELVVDFNHAKEHGMMIPEAVLRRADQVFQ
jgi:hypothetical protein